MNNEELLSFIDNKLAIINLSLANKVLIDKDELDMVLSESAGDSQGETFAYMISMISARLNEQTEACKQLEIIQKTIKEISEKVREVCGDSRIN